ncbi:barstar family protein [Lentzea sp. JNUCC 0626]|uniref:barstar family protein n=1 Tax=Lentzea sp. JNUCC 0626 TaxID=3367513 RepID=UPI003748D530
MNLADLLKPGPAVHLTTAPTAELGVAVAELATDDPTTAARRVRGSRSRTIDAFFSELGAALQFPSYFGENWQALSDVLSDLDWMPADAYLVVVEDAELLLADEPETLALALRIFVESAEEAEVPYRFLLQAPAQGRVVDALTANGTSFSAFVL